MYKAHCLNGQRVFRRCSSGSFDRPFLRQSGGRLPENFLLLLSWCCAQLRQFIVSDGLPPLDGDDRRQRASWVLYGIVAAALIVAFRVYALQATQYRQWTTLARKQHQTQIKIQGARGSIFDAEGRALAVSVEALSVGVHPRAVHDKRQAAAKLASVLLREEEEILQKLNAAKPFIWLARGLPREKEEEVAALRVPGIETFQEFRRDYPHAELGRIVLGQLSLEGRGQSGAELEFDKVLSAKTNIVPVRRDARGRRFAASLLSDPAIRGRFFSLDERADETASLREEGSSVMLTLDVTLQSILEEELAKGREDAQAKRVLGLLMDADTGEVLALGEALHAAVQKAGAVEALRNGVIQDSFEPGSSFKPIVAAVALDLGLVSQAELIDCENGRYSFGGHVIGDVHPVGTVPFSEVLVRSSNIGMTKIGARIGKERLYRYLRAFGFGDKPGIGLPGEGKGIMRDPGRWAVIDLATTSFGQGISVTPLQLVRAYSAIANGGYLVKPRIEKSDAPIDRTRIISQRAASALAQMLVGVTVDEDGTGKLAALHGIPVSGKTGTAQKPRLGGRGYDPDRVFASFVGFVDAATIGIPKRLVMLVAVDEPQVRPRWGGVLAAPVFRRAMERSLSYLMAHRPPDVQTAKDKVFRPTYTEASFGTEKHGASALRS